jgi:AbrB family looped-hinge helix DNA binding protein
MTEKPGTIGPKGQVTVPVKVRKEMNLQCGDYIQFVRSNYGVIIRKVEVKEVQKA